MSVSVFYFNREDKQKCHQCKIKCVNRRTITNANRIVIGKQTLSLNGTKLLRDAIMQSCPQDKELKSYTLTTSDLASLLHISKDNIYRVITDVAKEIMSSYIEIKTDFPQSNKTKKINWVTLCEYEPAIGLTIKLNNDMKEYLIYLKNHYSQYPAESILSMKSIYGVRIFELLQERLLMTKQSARCVDIEFSMKYLRERCNCEDKYLRYSGFKTKVLDRAIKEINAHTQYKAHYSCKKTAHAVTSIIFHLVDKSK